MLTWTAVLFAVAAAGGLVLVSMRARGGMPPLWLALLHGAVAATALGLLLVAVVRGPTGGFLTSSLVVFVVAALGGFLLLASHLRKGAFPLGGALAHGGAAVVAFLLLLAALLM